MPHSLSWPLASPSSSPDPSTPTYGYSAEAYGRMLKHLLPRGVLFNLGEDSFVSKLMHAIGDELERLSDRGVDFIEETDPRTATETLDEWERMLGLPDHCIEEIPATDAERRLAITQKLITIGGQDASYYVLLAAACGYTVEVEDGYSSTVFRAGHRCGERVYGTDWAYVWKIVITAEAGTALSHTELECIIERAAPAHTLVLFEYPP